MYYLQLNLCIFASYIAKVDCKILVFMGQKGKFNPNFFFFKITRSPPLIGYPRSLFLSPALISLSHLHSWQPPISLLPSSFYYMRRTTKSIRHQNLGGQLSSGQLIGLWHVQGCVVDRPSIEFTGHFDDGSRSQTTHLSFFFKMIPFISTKSARIVVIYLVQLETLQVYPSQTKPYKGNNLEFLLVTKNAFQWHIICLCLVSFAKKITFF